jgi:ribonuclease D
MSITLHKDDLPAGVTFTGSVAIDTETLGLNPHRDRLCLVQLSAGDGKAHLIQIRQGVTAAPRLKALLADEGVLKVFHYARFDLAALFHHLGVMPRPVFCTKIASKLTRTYTDRHGLKDLCKELIGVELSKEQQSSDWGAPSLTNEQLGYAAADVLHLHKLKAQLEKLLEREGRTDLAEACFRFLPARAELDLLGLVDPDVLDH